MPPPLQLRPNMVHDVLARPNVRGAPAGAPAARSVSVVIPCYNYAHYLPACVHSVLTQVGVKVRVLILDDASTDNTTEVAASLAAIDSRVTFVRHTRNMGHIATYNEGLDLVQDDYTVLLSADDMLTPGALSRAVQLMEAHPDVGFVYGGCVTFANSHALPVARTQDAGRWRIHDGQDWLKAVCRKGNTGITSPEVVVRTSVQRTAGGYLASLPHTGDQEMWMRLAVRASVGQLLDADQAYYRVHPRSMHNQHYTGILKYVQHQRAAFESFFQGQGALIPDRQQLQACAYRRLANDALWVVMSAFVRGQVAHTPVQELAAYAEALFSGRFWSRDRFLVYLSLGLRALESAMRRLQYLS